MLTCKVQLYDESVLHNFCAWTVELNQLVLISMLHSSALYTLSSISEEISWSLSLPSFDDKIGSWSKAPHLLQSSFSSTIPFVRFIKTLISPLQYSDPYCCFRPYSWWLFPYLNLPWLSISEQFSRRLLSFVL